MQLILHNSCETPIVENCTAESHGCSLPNSCFLEKIGWGWVYSDRSEVFPSQELLVAGAWRRMQGQEECIIITRILSQPHVGCEPNTVGLLQSEIMSYFLKIFLVAFSSKQFFQQSLNPFSLLVPTRNFGHLTQLNCRCGRVSSLVASGTSSYFLLMGISACVSKKGWIIMPYSPSPCHLGFDSSSL